MPTPSPRHLTAEEIAHALGGKRNGSHGWKAQCPAHTDSDPSLGLTQEGDRCLVHCYAGCSNEAVIDALRARGLWGTTDAPRPAPTPSPPRARWTALPRPPEGAPAPPSSHPVLGTPARVWRYLDGDGALLGLVHRYDTPAGKEIRPVSWCRNADGQERWHWQSLPTPRPLYGLDRLAARPAAAVIVVEGEKAADAAQELAPSAVVVTWSGGGKALRKADWSPLKGRRVLLWPDADEPGRVTMDGLAEVLENIVDEIYLLDPPHDASPGWDAADALEQGWDTARLRAYIQQARREPRRPATATTPDAPTDTPPDPPVADRSPDALPGQPFRSLGYDHGVYYFLPSSTRQVIGLKIASLNKQHLMHLAPLEWWSGVGDIAGEKGPSWSSAANMLMAQSHRVGAFDPSRIRGRGAWYDDGRAVIHLGDRLLVDGKRRAIDEISTSYIYEQGVALEALTLPEPATVEESQKLVDLFDRLAWERATDALLLAGFVFLAPICGALRWRPHVFLTGSAGSGKSWVYDHLVVRALGDFKVHCQGSTTEAFVRQLLLQDALPVVFDEMDMETPDDQKRIQRIIELARQASSESSALIGRGSALGHATGFRIRSMFAFGGVNPLLSKEADESRITPVSLRRGLGPDHFKALAEDTLSLLTPEYTARLRARAYGMLQTVRRNVEVMSRACAELLGNQRAGDQLGTLLAGASCMVHDDEISLEDARAGLQSLGICNDREKQVASDEERCLAELLSHQVRVEYDRGAVTRTLGELAGAASGIQGTADPVLTRGEAADALSRNGIRVDLDCCDLDGTSHWLTVSNNHRGVRAALRESPWCGGWAPLLARTPGARRKSRVKFAGGAWTRALQVPIQCVVGGGQ